MRPLKIALGDFTTPAVMPNARLEVSYPKLAWEFHLFTPLTNPRAKWSRKVRKRKIMLVSDLGEVRADSVACSVYDVPRPSTKIVPIRLL